MCVYPRQIKVKDKNGMPRLLTVKCGQCLECSREISNEWALRICLEMQYHAEVCCLTLTYAELPPEGLLVPQDMTLFLKRLRKAISPIKIRYFYSGEYGDRRGRPHYHCIIFGWRPSDLVYKFTKQDRDYYLSKTVSDLWRKGNILVGDVDFKTAFYTAKYLQKAVFKEKKVPPFVRMSTHPGIGYNAIFDRDIITTDTVYYNGRSYRTPRYFLKVLEQNGVVLDDLKERRILTAKINEVDPYSDPNFIARRKKSDEFFGKRKRNEEYLPAVGQTVVIDDPALLWQNYLFKYGLKEVSPDEFIEANAVEVG